MLFVATSAVMIANGQSSQKAVSVSPAVQAHLNAAKAAENEPGANLSDVYDNICRPATSVKGPTEADIQRGPGEEGGEGASRVPERSTWYTPPVKAFDNLYYLGSIRQSTWALTTSEGIVLIDSGFDYSVKDEIIDGMKTMHLDPTQIKYIVISHAHSDRFYGSRYLQDTYHPHIIMSAADWDVIEKSKDPADVKPKRDMVATDGMKLKVGDATLIFNITPGHTPGTVSTVISPLKDGNERHVGVVWGGINPDEGRMGVRYFPDLTTTFKTWSASAARFEEIAEKASADVWLTLHPHYDHALDKFQALATRKPGAPNPMVNKEDIKRFLTITKECTDAQLARISESTIH